ncbi:MAG: RluA family pseudouridine synthase [Parvibaculales bacterium]
MAGVQHLEVQPDQDGMRVDRWFRSLFPSLRQGDIEKMLRKGQIRIDGARAKSSARLVAGQTVRVPPMPTKAEQDARRAGAGKPRASAALRQQIRDAVIYKDDDILVLNKPSGLAVQGGSKTHQHVDGLLDELVFDGSERPRLVHRLDRDTSGVLILGRSRKAASFLTKVFAERRTRKLYWALTHGVPRPEQGDIKLPLIKRAAADGQERVRPVRDGEKGGLKAVTRFAVLQRAGQDFAWVSFMPLTGRTHQIRAHALAIGHPLVGDPKYADDEVETGRGLAVKLHLHARSLELPHPRGGIFQIEAPLGGHMKQSWDFLAFEERDGADPFPENDWA